MPDSPKPNSQNLASEGETSEATERFVQLITQNQNRLFGYVYSLLGDANVAHDVVQETNLVLWRKMDQYDDSRPFVPWALGIARFQVLSHIRDRQRDRILLDDNLAETLSVEAIEHADHVEAYREALRDCMTVLAPKSRQIIDGRYFRKLPIAEIASQLGQSVGAVKVALLRTRRRLGECIEQSIQQGLES